MNQDLDELWTVKMPDGTQRRFPLAQAQRVAFYAAAHHGADIHKSTAERSFTLSGREHEVRTNSAELRSNAAGGNSCLQPVGGNSARATSGEVGRVPDESCSRTE